MQKPVFTMKRLSTSTLRFLEVAFGLLIVLLLWRKIDGGAEESLVGAEDSSGERNGDILSENQLGPPAGPDLMSGLAPRLMLPDLVSDLMQGLAPEDRDSNGDDGSPDDEGPAVDDGMKQVPLKVAELTGGEVPELDDFWHSDAGDSDDSEDGEASLRAKLLENIGRYIDVVKRLCGEVCNQYGGEAHERALKRNQAKDVNPWNVTYVPVPRKRVDCRNLFEITLLEDKATERLHETLKRPFSLEELPDFYRDPLTYNGRVPIFVKFFKSQFDYSDRVGNKGFVWPNKKAINEEVARLQANHHAIHRYGSYHMGHYVYAKLKRIGLKGKRVLVVGSAKPWIEIMALSLKVAEVVTLDYQRLTVDHPKMFTVTPKEFAQTYLNGTLRPFDVMITFSSVEHSGLGRYGDILNPWGDLITLAQSWCVLVPGGHAVVGVPSTFRDVVRFNGGRNYGPVMLPHLLANFRLLADFRFRRSNSHFDHGVYLVKAGK